MRIEKNYLLAEAVVSLFIFEAEGMLETEEMSCWIDPHVNCRERGFNIHISGGKFPSNGFSFFVYEHRNMDTICVTISTAMEWDYITEKDYSTEKQFGHDVQKTVDYIIKHVTGKLHLGKRLEEQNG